MAMDYNADNPVFGRTNNPHNPLRTPGGSSGGEAAAIVTGMSPCGLGSDLAGSIRIPAHFCGVSGLKPTTGRVPGAGQCPPSIGPYGLGAVIGPIARHISDLNLLYQVLAGIETGGSHQERLRGESFAWYTDDGVAPVSAETRAAVQIASAVLEQAGLNPNETRPPGIERGHELWLKLFSRASVVQLRKLYMGHEEVAGSFVRWRLATADDTPPQTLDEYINAWMERDQQRERLLHWMNDFPLLLAPVGATNAPEHDALKVDVDGIKISAFRAFSYSQAFNVYDLPVVCVPVGKSADGLPIGVQIAGRPFAEDTVLAAAAIIEQAFATL
jgi:amidase